MTGEIVQRFGVDTLYMCADCTTVRYGHAALECPACGHEDVVVLKLNESPHQDE